MGELDNPQKLFMQMIDDLSKYFLVALNVVRAKITDVSAKLNLTMRAVENQALAVGEIRVNRIKRPEPKPFYGAHDAKTLENFIFDMEQYLRTMNMITEDSKITLVTIHLIEDAKLWCRFQFMDIQESQCTINT